MRLAEGVFSDGIELNYTYEKESILFRIIGFGDKADEEQQQKLQSIAKSIAKDLGGEVKIGEVTIVNEEPAIVELDFTVKTKEPIKKSAIEKVAKTHDIDTLNEV